MKISDPRLAARDVLRPVRAPTSTYRLQLGPGLGFREAAGLAGYLRALGAGAAYFSPYFRTAPGDANSYAVVDPATLNPELGTQADYDDLCARLSGAGLGHVADIVPNHMGVGGGANPYWDDVLERGRESRCAEFFDIDWNPAKAELENKVQLPVLEDFYGRVLEKGLLRLEHERGRFRLAYRDRRFPLAPRSWALIVERGLERSSSRLTASASRALREAAFVASLGDGAAAARRLGGAARRLPAVRRFLAYCVALYGGRPGDAASFDLLDELLERQHYRLAHWRAAADEINYRRFFNCNELAAVRIESESVFEACHRLVFRLLEEGKVTGLRIDHPDGLWDPPAYFARLQDGWVKRRLARLGVEDAPPEGASPLYVVVEKILDRREPLAGDWRVRGTVGYDALNAINGLFVDPAAEGAMTELYETFTGRARDFEALIHDSKRVFLKSNMAGEIEALGRRLDAVSEGSRYHRDFTRRAITAAVRETISCFPVYRTYIAPRDRVPSRRDERYVRVAIAKAKASAPELGPEVFDFLQDVLLLEAERGLPRETRERYRDVVMRFQQLTAPVMAKGLEDTAFYADNRLISLNEVGGDPGRFGCSPAEFHRLGLERARSWPGGLVPLTTHDAKRSSDARLRVSALTELAGEWKTFVEERAARGDGREAGVERDDEYFIYQTLVAAWPDGEAEAASGEFSRRVRECVRKSLREANRRTSWIRPDEDYEAAVDRFVVSLLERGPFLRAFLPLQRRAAAIARGSALSALVLQLAMPGVPDVYQGDELWNCRLVDPDNRAPVDFAARRRALASLGALLGSGRPRLEAVRELLAEQEDGRVKLFVLREGLRLRRRLPEVFAEGAHVPLKAVGPRADRVVAFLRRRGPATALAAAGRLLSRAGEPGFWDGTRVLLPDDGSPRAFRDELTHRRVRARTRGGRAFIPAAELLSPLGAALLASSHEG